jgi:hypothetical protein
LASSAALASIRVASWSKSLPLSIAGVSAQPGKARRAASTARSTSASPASTTSASLLPSCGLKTSNRAPEADSTNSPSMKRRSII